MRGLRGKSAAMVAALRRRVGGNRGGELSGKLVAQIAMRSWLGA
jgi:hypothetical protein